jgi:2-keto-4-pentenoate hydratase
VTGFDARPAAEALIEARRRRLPAGPLAAGIAPRDEAEAALVQRAIADLTQPGKVGGFKIGATGQRMQAYLGIDHPCAGFMAQADLHHAGAILPHASFRNLAIECELAVRLAADLPAGPCARDAAASAVGELFAAIEIVENRYGAPPIGDVTLVGIPTLIADQFYHAAAVLGEARPDWRTIDLVDIEGRASLDGQQRNAGRGRELLGDPIRGLAWLAGSPVAAAFGGLRAGQVIMLGSVTPPVWIEQPGTVHVEFEGLAPVTVQFV